VHNIRIERLWVDVTSGFGGKWKAFFKDLEAWDGLDVDNNTHIWLLHHLFLPAINVDAQYWAGSWNNHILTISGARSRSPRDMFFFGMLREGPRGVELEDLAGDEIAGYGVDWEDLDDHRIRAHHDHANGHDDFDLADAPYSQQIPENLSNIEINEPHCPLTPEQVQFLDSRLEFHGRSMEACRILWISALEICRSMYM